MKKLNFLGFLLFFGGLLLLATCGDEDKKKKGTSPTVNTQLVPADWDGKSDYSSSSLEVVDDE